MSESIERVGVIGAGVIGTTLAQDLAQTGHRVVLVDIDASVVARALENIAISSRLHHLAAGGERQNVSEVMERIVGGTDYAALAEVDFVVENITEERDAKRSVYQRLDQVCDPRCIIAANTSVIPISGLAEYTTRAENLVGIHFMNPVPMTGAVELIRGERTSDRAVASATRLLGQLGKRVIAVGDSPGFVSNRVLMQMINEAAFLLEENVADASEIDAVFTSCFGHPMGPLATADLIGIDTILRSVVGLQTEFADPKYRPCGLLQKMVDQGHLGRKSGQGFHSYQMAR